MIFFSEEREQRRFLLRSLKISKRKKKGKNKALNISANMGIIHSVSVLLFFLLKISGFIIATSNSQSLFQRIAEGELTTLGQYPNVLSLGLSSWAGIYHLHYCSGLILTENWVLTTANCVEDAVEDVSRYYWLAGTNNLRQGGSKYFINRIIIHPGYNPNDSFIHDLALVQVSNPFAFSASIQPTELSTLVSDTWTKRAGVIAGWGQVSQTLIQPDILRSANVTILDVDICGDIYSPWNINIDGEYQFCAITDTARIYDMRKYKYDYVQLGKSACRGDEGAPFIVRGVNFPLRISGIISWTFNCSPFGYPAVLTKISSYLNWISENTDYWI